MATLRFECKSFEQLTVTELYQVLQAREAVFTLEQQCACQDMDGIDVQAWHLLAYQPNQPDLVAYARILPAGLQYPQVAIGRVLTLKPHRGQQVGRRLMQAAIDFIQHQWQTQAIKISAQAYLQDFYHSLGFVTAGDLYLEGGISHIAMVKSA